MDLPDTTVQFDRSESGSTAALRRASRIVAGVVGLSAGAGATDGSACHRTVTLARAIPPAIRPLSISLQEIRWKCHK